MFPDPNETLGMKSRERWILGVCFLISGATGLILEVAWSKQLSYILGSSLYGTATIVAAFMAGLGIGGALAARFAGRFARPVRVYAAAEGKVWFRSGFDLRDQHPGSHVRDVGGGILDAAGDRIKQDLHHGGFH